METFANYWNHTLYDIGKLYLDKFYILYFCLTFETLINQFFSLVETFIDNKLAKMF